MNNNIDTVRNFFHAWGRSTDDLRSAVNTYLSPDAVWENIGMSVTTGPQEIITFLEKYLSGAKLATFDVEILHIAGSGDTVFVERVDRAVKLDGSVRPSPVVRVVGVFDLKDGKIVAWRDYFDTAPHKH
ncbi:MAG: limonene-1,2-epoxide hydrolase family protein [Porticoccaceae bacterium]